MKLSRTLLILAAGTAPLAWLFCIFVCSRRTGSRSFSYRQLLGSGWVWLSLVWNSRGEIGKLRSLSLGVRNIMSTLARTEYARGRLHVRLLSGCDGALQVQGTVLDSENRAVVGAQIDATPFPASRSDWNARFHGQSRADACFHLAGIVSPFPTKQVPLTVAAAGYKPAAAEVQSPASNRVFVTLVRKGSVGESHVLILAEDSPFPCSSSSREAKRDDP
jgi:hypothetical protein